YTASNLTSATYYRAVVTSGACAPANSDAVVIEVSPAAVGGAIDGEQPVPFGVNTTALSLTGYTGTIAKWQSSLDGITFTDISETAGATSFQAINLESTTYYRAVVVNGVCTTYSDTAVMLVSPASVGGRVIGSTTVCTGSNTTTLYLRNYTGSIQWQSAAVGDTFANISGATRDSLVVTNLTATKQYRAIVTSGVYTPAISDTATIAVSELAVGGSVSGSAPVCYNSNSSVLSLSGNNGSVVRWEYALDSNFTNATLQSTSDTFLAVNNLTQTTYYRVRIANGACSTYSSRAVLTVNPASNAGTASGDTLVCTGTNSAVIRLSGTPAPSSGRYLQTT
ncbi:MAG: hypothetical protein ACKO6K_05215, partial [Chitinophagaceae bacterium]